MSLHFYTFRYTFFRPPFFGLIHWFRAKTTWGTHPTGFLSSKKWILDFFKKNFRKSGLFREKTKKKILLVLFVSEWTENHSRHTLQLFSSYKPIKTGKKYQDGCFLNFFLFFTTPHSRPILPWRESLKSMFCTWFQLLASQTPFWRHNLNLLCSTIHGKKSKTCFLGLRFSKKLRFAQFGSKRKTKGTLIHWKKS